MIVTALLLQFVIASQSPNVATSNLKASDLILGLTWAQPLVRGVWRDGQVDIIPSDSGNHVTPAYVAFTADGNVLVGDAAKEQAASNPSNTVHSAKRLIGRPYSDPSVQADMKLWPFAVKHGESAADADKPYIAVVVNNQTNLYSAEDISAMVLGKLKDIWHTHTLAFP